MPPALPRIATRRGGAGREAAGSTRFAADSSLVQSSVVPAGKSPICGNSICQDRRFLHRLMPRLERYFHYRNLDVSTIKELARRWAPDVSRGFSKESTHTALSDVRDSIAELRYYRPFMGRIAGALEAP